jgi:hypothetical protein
MLGRGAAASRSLSRNDGVRAELPSTHRRQPRYLKLIERTPEPETGGFASPLRSGFAQNVGGVNRHTMQLAICLRWETHAKSDKKNAGCIGCDAPREVERKLFC